MTDQAAKLRNAFSDLEFLMLEQNLQADAHYIAGLTVEGKSEEAQAYIRESRFIERRDAWRAGRNP